MPLALLCQSLLLSLPLSLSVHSIISINDDTENTCYNLWFCQNLLQQCDQDLRPPESIVHAQM